MTHHIVLGAGPAGLIAAETLRKHAPLSRITLVGDEAEPPYSRMAIPYLLMGNIDESGTYLRKSEKHLTDLNITQLHARATRVDADIARPRTEDGISRQPCADHRRILQYA